jgi:hypothetical protein
MSHNAVARGIVVMTGVHATRIGSAMRPWQIRISSGARWADLRGLPLLTVSFPHIHTN